MAKTRLAFIFGGVSNEHEISCMSAASIIENTSTESFEIFQIGITKEGRWLYVPCTAKDIKSGKWAHSPDCRPAHISPDRGTHGLLIANGQGGYTEERIDVVFPVLHGKNGEDGTIQGLLELAGIPYVGCNVLSSALCMDKAMVNQLFDLHRIPHTLWMQAHKSELENFEKVCFQLGEKLRFPIFVKPSVGGSSIGISKAKNAGELHKATMLALESCDTVLYEQAVVGIEVECAVLGNEAPIVSMPGEVVSCKETYDYEAKYFSGDASKQYVPARLPAEKLEEIKTIALRAYSIAACTGLARIDFFVEKSTGRVLLNEINTLPGFTSISMYPKLMEAYGVPYPALISRLVYFASEKKFE